MIRSIDLEGKEKWISTEDNNKEPGTGNKSVSFGSQVHGPWSLDYMKSEGYVPYGASQPVKVDLVIREGNIPKPGKDGEVHAGFLFGGHVVLDMKHGYMYGFSNNTDIGREAFGIAGDHIVPSAKYKNSIFQIISYGDWKETEVDQGEQFDVYHLTISITQYSDILSNYQETYLTNTGSPVVKNPPMDYALFGVRCQSSCYGILNSSGVLPDTKPPFTAGQFNRFLMKQGYMSDFIPGDKTKYWFNTNPLTRKRQSKRTSNN